MKNKSHYLLVLLVAIFIISFPSVCSSELKTVEGEYCDVYMGDFRDKKELDNFREIVRAESIKKGLCKLTTPRRDDIILLLTDKCISYIVSNYLEKLVVVRHTEKRRKICDKVRITLDSEVMNKYLSQYICNSIYPKPWWYDIDDVLTKKTEKINIGLIIETKITGIELSEKEQLENEQEKQFFDMTVWKKDKYKVVDRRHLSMVLEEQKLSSSGITESDTVKLGKILNLDIIVLRLIYENTKVTKVLKVDTGEVLLLKTYEGNN